MLDNFQLAAIVTQAARTRLLRVPLHQALQDNLAQSWDVQYDDFVNETDEISFDPGYQPEQHERFSLSYYEPPMWLANEESQTVGDLSTVNEINDLLECVRGLAGFARDARGREVVLFQNFTRSKIVQPGSFLFLERDTYTSTNQPALILDYRLSAVYLPNEKKLLFRNFRTVNTFLPLSDFYEEASEQEIRDVLAHERLSVEDPDQLAVGANQWVRKRFAMLRDSDVLDQFSANDIRTRAQGYGVAVRVSNGRIVFPSNKTEARKLLQLLNEERFRGPLTAMLYETNSKRPAEG